ncbi:MAG: hypothetical protein R3F55_04835 [Alphaproteobacteria bacterium]
MRNLTKAALPLALILCAQAAQAALPPEHQRARELDAIINSMDVLDQLQHQPIDSIEYVGTDLYRVAAGSCSVEVRIVDRPADEQIVGPRVFDIEIEEGVCE